MAYKKDELDARILQAISEFDGVPTAGGIGSVLRMSSRTIQRRMEANPAINVAMEARGNKWIDGLGENLVLKKYGELGWMGGMPDYAKTKIRERIDNIILQAIDESDGVPTASSIGNTLHLSHDTIQKCIDAKPVLATAMEKRGKAWIDGLSEALVLKKFSKMQKQPFYAQTKIHERINKILLRIINEFDGVPTAGGIGKVLRIESNTITRRIAANPALTTAMEARGNKWIDGLDEKLVLKKYSKTGGISGMPAYAQTKIYERIDEIILRTINEFDRIPSACGIGNALKISGDVIGRRIEANPAISAAMEARGNALIDGLDDATMFLKFYADEKCVRLPDYAQRKIHEVMNTHILKKIHEFQGVPIAEVIGNALGISGNTIISRIGTNPDIGAAMEARGNTWIAASDEKLILKKYVARGWLRNLPIYAQTKIYERLDEIIVRTINEFDGVPTGRRIGTALNLGHNALQRRIEANPDLWLAYYAKRGLTLDQAVELALEHREDTVAFRQALNQRLAHLSAFREMVGIIKCFGDLLKDGAACVSLYPEPLEKVAQELGVTMNVTSVPMDPFRKGEAPAIPKTGTVVAQRIHRLDEDGLTNLFIEIGKNHSAEKPVTVITTHSMDYAATEPFLEAMGKAGFSLAESGIVRMDPPDDGVLMAYGVGSDDLERMKRKVSTEFNVLVFKTNENVASVRIPSLQKAASMNGNERDVSEAEGVDVPKGINKELKAKLFSSCTVVATEPFIVEIMQDGGNRAAIIGYDMDTKKPRSIEFDTYENAPSVDYRSIARKMAGDIKFRNTLGVKPNAIVNVPLSKCKA